MLKRIIKIVSVILALIITPVSLFICGIQMAPQFTHTYYSQLANMYKRLQQTQGKRIITVGNSSVAFAVKGDLIEGQLKDYSVCPFGLYGAIGTKAMMDLSRVNICEGDIVILAPEQGEQSMSLYFNGEYLWKAIDGNFDMLAMIDDDNLADMVGSYPKFISDKYGYFKEGEAPDPEGIYNSSSFDEHCNLVYDRPYNLMLDGYNKDEVISYKSNIVSEQFIDYVNEYNKFITQKGATLLFAFTPVNAMGIELNTTEENVDSYYDFLDNNLDCDILGNPHNYIMDSEWFYDSNVHLNSAGSVVYTRQMITDLKIFLKDSSPTDIELPQKPQTPEEDDDEPSADGVDAALFTYEQTTNGYTVTGLTELGKTKTSVTVPDYYNGKKVTVVAANTFAGNTKIVSIYWGANVKRIEEYSFTGCTALKNFYLPKDNTPGDCLVNRNGFDSLKNLNVYVPQDKVSDYILNYFWSQYGEWIKGY